MAGCTPKIFRGGNRNLIKFSFGAVFDSETGNLHVTLMNTADVPEGRGNSRSDSLKLGLSGESFEYRAHLV